MPTPSWARCCQPAKHGVGRRIRESLHVGRPAAIVPFGQVVVVGVESAIEPKPAIEREAGHERRCPVTRLPEIFGGRLDPRRQREAAVVPEPMAEGDLAGQDRGVRRSRSAGLSHRCLEADTSTARASIVGVEASLVSVAPDVVRAERVDRDQQHVRPVRGRGA